MKQSEIIEHIYKVYPKNISYFQQPYNYTKFINLSPFISANKETWMRFLQDMVRHFDQESVRDRTDGEPSNICAVNIAKEELLFEFVIYVSFFAPCLSICTKKIMLTDRTCS
jgi:hypothetical protein